MKGTHPMNSMNPEQPDTGEIMSERFITVWRKPDDPFEWWFHISDSRTEMAQVVDNLLRSWGAKEFTTYRLGERMAGYSQDYVEDTPTPEQPV